MPFNDFGSLVVLPDLVIGGVLVWILHKLYNLSERVTKLEPREDDKERDIGAVPLSPRSFLLFK